MHSVLLLCLCIGVNHAMRQMSMPTELQRALDQATSLESFINLISVTPFSVSADRPPPGSFAQKILNASMREIGRGKCPINVEPAVCPKLVENNCSDDSSCQSGMKCCKRDCRMDCVRGVGPDGRKASVGFLDLPRVMLDNELCAPRPVVVEVPQPVNQAAIYFPFYVTLHRCGGSCNARPIVTKCAPRELVDLNLMVSRVSWSSSTDRLGDLSKDVVGVRVTNHTKCGCKCVTKPTDCDNLTQDYSKENCRCECKPQRVSCPLHFQWDPIKCQCRCNPTSMSCNKRLELDKERCACVCSTKACRFGKVRDPTDCRCKCPRRKCLAGQTYDRRICKCMGLRRVSEDRR